MQEIVEKAKNYFYSTVHDFGSDPYGLLPHLPLVEQQMRKCLERFPEANKEVALLGVRLHDVGHYPLPTDIDHAVRGEERARIFLQENNIDIYIKSSLSLCEST